MLSWYRNQAKTHGALAATRLLSRVVWARGRTTIINKVLPKSVQCPCCGWEGGQFYDYLEVGFIHRKVECPQCNSHARHRTLYTWLQREFRLQEKEGTALVFAPEKALDSVWQQASHLRAHKVDIKATRGVNVLADLQRLPFASDSVDLIWCHHVLQLIEDDRAAIRELYRVLRPPTGEVVLSVALAPGTTTEEYGSMNEEVMNFWRMYGDDFVERLAEAGFHVQTINYKPSPEERRRYGIDSEDNLFICVKDSYS